MAQLDTSAILPADQDLQFADHFAAELMLWAAGNANALPLNQFFQPMLDGVVNLALKELALIEGDEARRAEVAIGAAQPGLGELFAGPDIPPISSSEAALAGMGPRNLSWIKPPGIVNTILSRIARESPTDATAIERSLQEEVEKTTDVCERAQSVASFLVTCGYARDPDLAKDDPAKSHRGARAQMNDIQHLAKAAYCHLFITGDKRCAKIAYATYEFLSLNTQVAWFDPRATGSPVKILGPDCWP